MDALLQQLRTLATTAGEIWAAGGWCMPPLAAVAVLMFRKWFGHEPDKSWFWKGNMAQASDRLGNVVEIDQHQSGPLRVVKYDPAFAAFQRTLALAS